jgi:hypothetical protein
MPFVSDENGRRAKLISGELEPETVGDICYIYYHYLIQEWKKEPRWTTWHNLCKWKSTISRNLALEHPSHFSETDYIVAGKQAYAVFFATHVMDYERQKQHENGDI